MNLLFERFVSRSRKNEPPDIDIDFEHEKREIVIQEIYWRYGRHRAALTGAIITFRPRSAIKVVGKALGMDFAQLNALTFSQNWWNGSRIDQEGLREHGLDPESPIVKKLVALSETFLGFPRQLSQHVGGFVIAQDSLCRLVSIENAAMEDRTVIEFDKDDIEALRFIKVDILALGILSAIRRTLEMTRDRRSELFTLQDVPSEDPATYDMICKSETEGFFRSNRELSGRCSFACSLGPSSIWLWRSHWSGRARSMARWCIRISADGRGSNPSTIRARRGEMSSDQHWVFRFPRAAYAACHGLRRLYC